MTQNQNKIGKVVNINKDDYDVYIGRGSKWGNPYTHKSNTKAKYVVGSRKEAIEKYERYLVNNKELMDSLSELVGKTLGCYCKPKSCHGDILLKHINNINTKMF